MRKMLITAALLLAGCASASQRYELADFAAEPKIDVHVHINSDSTALIDQARADGFRLLTINVDYPDFPPLAQQQALAHTHAQNNPETVAFAASFAMAGWDETGWQARVQQQLNQSFADGAVAIKVWKNIGMDFRDREGKLVMIDDARFDAIFEQVREHGKVLIGHQGEPHNCWLPLEQMTVSNDREYFHDHPQYHMFLHPELPSYETQMAVRDRMLSRHPQLKFMGAHMASLEWSFVELAKFLERFPLAVVDLAARMGQVEFQSNHDRAAARAFFIKYQDRLLYGTDLTQEPGSEAAAMRKDAHDRWRSDWIYFTTEQTQRVAELAAPVQGLGLPRSVIDKLYYRNAERTFGKVWRPPAAGRALATLQSAQLRLEFDARLHSRVTALIDGAPHLIGDYAASESLDTTAGAIEDFKFDSHVERDISDRTGSGHLHEITGHAGGIEKRVQVTLYDEFPRWAVMQVRYTNRGSHALQVRGWRNGAYTIARAIAPGVTRGAAAAADEPDFWSYQSGSYENRPDWVLPLKVGFERGNFQGMNAADYGGGTPIVDVWRRDAGMAVGQLELTPRLVSLPVARPGAAGATLSVRFALRTTLEPGASVETLRTFTGVHRGDHFQTLSDYRRFMVKQGMQLPVAPPSAFEPLWCAWGYGRDATVEQVIATLPIVKQLGFGWVTLDDGWQVAEGDWTPNPIKYPHGDADMKALVEKIHAAGLKAQLWWSPLAADPGSPVERVHPEQLLLLQGGSRSKISWWDAYFMCPAYEPVRADGAAFARKALGEWGFDGLKVDGQHLNGAPQCFNPAHHHAEPTAAVEGLAGFFKSVWDASHQAKSDALVEICPCGTSYSFFNLPYMNMTVASDPESSWQVRLKGKTLKALSGDGLAYFGDHVEMSEGGDDFASTLGVGGVVGSNFVWPGAPGKKDPKLLLTPEREREWAFWVKQYQDKRLSEGQYLGSLYDIGFDRPETHAISKGNRLYYAFFAPQFAGKVELRGLGTGRYRVHDYEADRELGVVSGPSAQLAVDFKKHLLIEVLPE